MSSSVGSWSDFQAPLTEEARNVFDAAFAGFTGVGYTPVAFATQVVSGYNYLYLTNSQVVYPGGSRGFAFVEIYAPATGNPKITAIKPITP